MITDQGYCDFCEVYRPLAEAQKERHGYYCPECSRGLIYVVREDYSFTITQDVRNHFGRNSWVFDDNANAKKVLTAIEFLLLGEADRGRK